MAGYFIVLGDVKGQDNVEKSAKTILRELCQYGEYSTNLVMAEGTSRWASTKVGTFADYFGMKENDFVFFFTDRKIYGVGKLVNIGNDCKYWSYAGASRPQTYSAEEIVESRLTEHINPENRCVCFFTPIEYYPHAVDMDEALTAFPDSFKALRTILGKSFIKLDDEEAMALFSVLHRGNNTTSGDNGFVDWDPPTFDDSVHRSARIKIDASPDTYRFTIESLLVNIPRLNESAIQEEMAVEAAVMNALSSDNHSPFDAMSYVSHQVSASPAKPVRYMEWMDVFGYSIDEYLLRENIPVHLAIKRYYVIEIKRDFLSLPQSRRRREPKALREKKAIANQLMKYVDWVAKNYANGNYPMVKGILIANGFDKAFIDYCKKVCVRNYNNGYRNSTPAIWDDFELIRYSFDGRNISFEKIPKDNPQGASQ